MILRDPVFSSAQWVAWLGTSIVILIGATAGAYGTFETQEHAERSRGKINDRITEVKGDLKDRLDKIDSKLETLIQRGK